MGISERKERAKQELRQIIIDAAAKIFVAEGYEKTSIRNIAEQIEYSPATIYLHFADKDELLFAVHEVAFAKFFEAMSKALLETQPHQKLLKMGEIYIDFAFKNPELYSLMFMDKAPMNKIHNNNECWDLGHKNHELLTSTVKECFKEKGISDMEAEILSLSIWSYVHGLSSLGIRDRFTILTEKGMDINTAIKLSLHDMLRRFLPELTM